MNTLKSFWRAAVLRTPTPSPPQGAGCGYECAVLNLDVTQAGSQLTEWERVVLNCRWCFTSTVCVGVHVVRVCVQSACFCVCGVTNVA